MEANITLWQFLLEILHSESYGDIIKWTNSDGEFKLINAEEVARMWGLRKNKTNMNYDKLSRALRYYYNKNIIRKVLGQKFVYRFVALPTFVKLERKDSYSLDVNMTPRKKENLTSCFLETPATGTETISSSRSTCSMYSTNAMPSKSYFGPSNYFTEESYRTLDLLCNSNNILNKLPKLLGKMRQNYFASNFYAEWHYNSYHKLQELSSIKINPSVACYSKKL